MSHTPSTRSLSSWCLRLIQQSGSISSSLIIASLAPVSSPKASSRRMHAMPRNTPRRNNSWRLKSRLSACGDKARLRGLESAPSERSAAAQRTQQCGDCSLLVHLVSAILLLNNVSPRPMFPCACRGSERRDAEPHLAQHPGDAGVCEGGRGPHHIGTRRMPCPSDFPTAGKGHSP
jgi:hypothetical protein